MVEMSTTPHSTGMLLRFGFFFRLLAKVADVIDQIVSRLPSYSRVAALSKKGQTKTDQEKASRSNIVRIGV